MTEARSPRLSSIKLRAPELRPITIRRPRLTRPLVAGRTKLVYVVAPPGHGKTSLLADWSEQDGRTFAWVTVDRNDSDPAVLWAYVAGALAKARHEELTQDRLTAMTRDPSVPSTVVHDIEAFGEELVLVFDDYYLIDGPTTHESVLHLLERAPSTLKVVIASRLAPPLAISRMRASGDVADIGPEDLRFTLDESQAFLNGSLGLDLDPTSIRILHERTEGWPAGLYLAYLSLRGAAAPKTFVKRFGASNRHVGDYLTEQVLETQDPETLQFMLATSVVDHICGSLADALTGRHDSTARLVELERANVFLTPLDDVGEWYRFHHLLRELLVIELRRRAPESEVALHQRAAAWFEAAGDIDRAIRHATDAGDTQAAARLISADYLHRMEWGQLATIAGWLDRLGNDAVDADPRLAIVKAWTMHFFGRHTEAQRSLAAALRSDFEGELPGGARSIESSAAMMSAAFPGGDVGGMVRSARRAFELESDRGPLRVTVHVALGYALVREGSFLEADPYLATGEELAVEAGMWMDAVGARCLRALVALARGDTTRALDRARSAVDLAGTSGVAQTATGAYARAVLGIVLVRAGQPEDGTAVLAEAIGPLRALGEPMPLAEALLAFAQGQRALGRPEEAAAALAEADTLIRSMPDPGVLRATRRSISTARRRSTPVDVPLSARELEVLRLLADGLSKREAATRLYVSYNTVHSHVRTIYRKLRVGTRAEAVARGRREGLVG